MYPRAPLVVQLVCTNAVPLRWQVLYERPAEPDVHDLDAPADGERGQTALTRGGEQRQLGVIARAVDGSQLGMRSLAVARGVDVFSSRQEETSDRVQEVSRGRGVRERRHDEWNQTDRLQCADVCRVQPNSLDAVDVADRGCHRDERRGSKPPSVRPLLVRLVHAVCVVSFEKVARRRCAFRGCGACAPIYMLEFRTASVPIAAKSS